MPHVDGEVSFCRNCKWGGSLGTTAELTQGNFHIVQEHVPDGDRAPRALGIVFASTRREDHRASMPVLVQGKIEVAASSVRQGSLGAAVIHAFAMCRRPNADGSCPAIDSCKLAQYLDQHSFSGNS